MACRGLGGDFPQAMFACDTEAEGLTSRVINMFFCSYCFHFVPTVEQQSCRLIEPGKVEKGT